MFTMVPYFYQYNIFYVRDDVVVNNKSNDVILLHILHSEIGKL